MCVCVCFMSMEKSRSLPEYSSSYAGEFDCEDRGNSYNFNGPRARGEGFTPPTDPELKRKKRIAAYNMFTTEGKLKSTMRYSFKWIKNKFTDVRYGVWCTYICIICHVIFMFCHIISRVLRKNCAYRHVTWNRRWKHSTSSLGQKIWFLLNYHLSDL